MTARLLAGLLLLLIVVVVAVVGPFLAPYDLWFQENIYYEEQNGERRLVVSPAAPSERHPLGTDIWGYDLLTILLHGARYTILATIAIAALRIVLAVAFVSAAPRPLRTPPGGAGADAARRGGFRLLAGLPPFIIVYFVLYGVTFNPAIRPSVLALVQGVVIAVIGLPALVPTVRGHLAEIAARDHVEAARSVGAGNLRVLWRHILPLFVETMVVLFSTEMVAVLTMLGQLGVFDVFMGGTIFQPSPPVFISISREWAGLIGQYRTYLSSSRWWLIVFPLVGYMVTLYGFYLLSRGLDELFQRRYRKTSRL